jgi:hypothetical protein
VAGGVSAPAQRLQLLTRYRRVQSTTDGVALALTLSTPWTAPTLANGAVSGGLLPLSSTTSGVGVSLDTSGAWAEGDSLLRAAVTVSAYSMAGPVVVVPAAFTRVTSHENVATVRLGTRVAPPVAQTVYKVSMDLLSRAGARRTVLLVTALCHA